MVVKTLIKQSFLSIKNTFKRFISILIIVLLGVGFYTGIKVTSPNMRESLNKYFEKQNMYDIELISTWGITEEEITSLKNEGYDVEGTYSFDTVVKGKEEYVAKVHTYDKNSKNNQLVLKEGRLPENDNECVIEDPVYFNVYKIGDKLTIEDDFLKEKTLTIVGFVNSPIYVSMERGSTTLLNGKINFYLYTPITNIDSDYYTNAYIFKNDNNSVFSEEYKDTIEKDVEKLEKLTKEYGENRYSKEKNDAINELNDNIKKYEKEKKDALKEIEDAKKEIKDSRKKVKNGLSELNKSETSTKKEFKKNKETINNNITKVKSGIKILKENISYLENLGSDTTELLNQLSVLEENLKILNSTLTKIKKEETKVYNTIKSNRKTLNKALDELDEAEEKLKKEEKKAYKEFEKAEKEIADAQKEIDEIEYPEWYVLDLETNLGYYQFSQDADRIENIAKLFPLLFYIVAILVSLTTMTRMVEEERMQLGTYKSLGYNDNQILFKYLLYALLATTIGSILGIFIGSEIIPTIIYGFYALIYCIGDFYNPINISISLAGSLVALLCIVLSTYIAVKTTLKEVPSELLRPKSPKVGKRVLLEKVPFIWKRLKFSNKVTIRNVFRYKKKFMMTILGIAGCTGLMIAGYGLQDCILSMVPNQYEKLFKYDLEITFDTKQKSLYEDIEKIKEIEEIENTLIVNKESVEILSHDTNQMVQLVVPFEDISDFITLQNRKTEEKLEFNNKIIVSEKLTKLLDLDINDKIKFETEEKKYNIEINGITENYFMHYIYMDKQTYNSDKFNTMFINLDNIENIDKDELSKKLKEFDSVSMLNYTSSNKNVFDRTMDSFGTVSLVLIVSAGMLAFVVLYNLSSINISERKRELASIKVLGFYDKEVYNYVSRENTILTTIGIIFGCLIGYILTMFIIKTCEIDMAMFGTKIDSSSYINAIIITIIFTVLVDIVTYFSLKNIKMVESLKSVE